MTKLFFTDLPNGETRSFRRGEVMQEAGKANAFHAIATGAKVTRVVNFKTAKPSLHECDSRCLMASGMALNCQCACRGKNHGRGWRCE
jgi:hypothetical protein